MIYLAVAALGAEVMLEIAAVLSNMPTDQFDLVLDDARAPWVRGRIARRDSVR